MLFLRYSPAPRLTYSAWEALRCDTKKEKSHQLKLIETLVNVGDFHIFFIIEPIILCEINTITLKMGKSESQRE